MSARLIGLGGLLRSGKDTVADYLVEEHGWVKLNMSDPLNEALLELDPWVDVSIHTNTDGADDRYYPKATRYSVLYHTVGYVEAKKNPEVRRLLQVLGTEVGRKMIDEDVWVDIARRKIKALMDEGTSVAITGIRYPNEMQMINSLRGQTVWVDRPDLVRSGGASTHSSETSVQPDQFNVLVLNNGTLDDLYRKVDDLFGFALPEDGAPIEAELSPTA